MPHQERKIVEKVKIGSQKEITKGNRRKRRTRNGENKYSVYNLEAKKEKFADKKLTQADIAKNVEEREKNIQKREKEEKIFY